MLLSLACCAVRLSASHHSRSKSRPSTRSRTYAHFRRLTARAYLSARSVGDRLLFLLDAALASTPDLPCFAGGRRAVMDGLRGRLRLGRSESDAVAHVNGLIDASADALSTRLYDRFQAWSQGIA